MADTSSGISDATVFVSLALFGVWMYRQKVPTLTGKPSRWGAFFGALSGKYSIVSNIGASSSSSSSSGSSNAPPVGSTSPIPGGVSVQTSKGPIGVPLP